MAKAKATSEIEAETKARIDAQRKGLCQICNTPRCTTVCPKARVKRAIAKLLLISAAVHFDATADPATARSDHDLACERGVVYYSTPQSYLRADSLAP